MEQFGHAETVLDNPADANPPLRICSGELVFAGDHVACAGAKNSLASRSQFDYETGIAFRQKHWMELQTEVDDADEVLTTFGDGEATEKSAADANPPLQVCSGELVFAGDQGTGELPRQTRSICLSSHHRVQAETSDGDLLGGG